MCVVDTLRIVLGSLSEIVDHPDDANAPNHAGNGEHTSISMSSPDTEKLGKAEMWRISAAETCVKNLNASHLNILLKQFARRDWIHRSRLQFINNHNAGMSSLRSQ